MSGLGSGGPDDNDAQAGRLVVADTVRSHPRPGSNSDGGIVVSPALTARYGKGTESDATDTMIAAPLSHGSNPNSNAAGCRREDDVNVIAFNASGGGEKDLSPTENIANPVTGSNGDPGAVAYPLARRGRDGGSELEVGEANVYNALRAGDGGSSRLNQVLTPETAVRRLTPIECERLQGLPDGWTQLGDTADSPRYAALGDAVTASVAEWIGRRIMETNP